MAVPIFDIPINSTVTFQITASKDGVVWNITGATVTLIITDDSGTATIHSATVTDGPAGVVQFTTTTSTITAKGRYIHHWRVVKDAIDIKSKDVQFNAF